MNEKPMDEGISSGRIVAEDDVEGHMPFRRSLEVEEDVEGHQRNGLTDDGHDDVEGHGIRIKI
jgi:hypothetical protein